MELSASVAVHLHNELTGFEFLKNTDFYLLFHVPNVIFFQAVYYLFGYLT